MISCLMLLPILLWVIVIVLYGVNIPWFDDFDPFPDFLRQWINNEGSVLERFRLVVQPNNEHRMVFGKLLVLVYYLITGKLDFFFLQIAGACFTLGTCFILWTLFKSSKINWWYFLPVPFLLFQLQDYLIFVWSICSLQHQPVIFFVCLSMYLLSKERFGWAMLTAVCATFAMSNGIFVWVGGAVILILRYNYRQLGFWLLLGIVSVGFYFYGMSAQGNESSLDFLVKNPHLSVLGFLAFLGGLFDLAPWLRIEFRSVLPVISSIVVLTWVLIWLLSLLIPWLKKYWDFPKRVPKYVQRFTPQRTEGRQLAAFMLGVMVFLLVNALVIGLLRPRFGFFVMLVSNYKLYPALFLTVCYLAFLSSTAGSKLQLTGFRIVLAVSIVIWILSAFNYFPTISERRKYLLVNGHNQQFNGFGLGHVPFSKGAEYVDSLMQEMVGKGIYTYPSETSLLMPAVTRVKDLPPSDMGVLVRVEAGVIGIRDSVNNFSYGYNDGNYVFIVRGDRTYLFKMNQNQYVGRNLLKEFSKGSQIEIPLSTLMPGSYKIGLVRIAGGNATPGIIGDVTVP